MFASIRWKVWSVSRCAAVMIGLGSAVVAQQNVLLIVADDLGVDRVAAYGEHPDPGRTPVLDALAADGILFRNVWSNPVCSTSRAALLTGRHGFRTGIGRGVSPLRTVELAVDEVSIADVVSPVYSTAAIGKWHLQTLNGAGPLIHPMLLGFSEYLGGMDVFPGSIFGGDGYFDFSKNENGKIRRENKYATTDEVDDALGFVNGLDEPWFVQLAFHAPHAPFHKPPSDLHSFSLPPEVIDDVPLHTKAMIEAMDTEIGRLLTSMDPDVRENTVIIFVGDNGTDKLATTAPHSPDHAKGTLFEGGINVPLIVAGPEIVSGAECSALVHITDIFATVADIASATQTTGVDSVSLFPYFSDPFRPSLRSWVYAELFSDNGYLPYERYDRAVRNKRYKLLHFHDPYSTDYREALFDLAADPFELDNLLIAGPLTATQKEAYHHLGMLLPTLREAWIDMGGAMAGSYGLPRLDGTGDLEGGDRANVTLTGAREDSLVSFMIGTDMVAVPGLDGVSIPNYPTNGSLFFRTTDASGALSVDVIWPSDLPAAYRLYLQMWVADPAGTESVAASNVLRATSG